jgi:tRNA modification GTPase
MMRELCGAGAAERLREGFEVALVGPPNVGKSTLLNALTGREVAITSDIAGTTRDVIEVRLDLRGLPVTLLDTAGLRDATDSIEEIGVERARIRAAASDLRVLLLEEPGTVPPGIDIRSDDIIVFGKADQGGRTEGFAVSGLTGQGIPELLDWIADVLERRVAGASTISHARQREAIARAITALEAACSALERPVPVLEIAADEVHRGLRALDFLVGKVDVETVLDTIFRSFCLGK